MIIGSVVGNYQSDIEYIIADIQAQVDRNWNRLLKLEELGAALVGGE